MKSEYKPSKESVLVLGAGLMQKPAFVSAKEEGVKVFSVDADLNAVCVPLSDGFRKIDLKDREGIFCYAKMLKEKENLKGIFTCGTDFSASVAYSSEKLGFKGHSFESALNASIKSRMRECFRKQGIPSPDFYSVCGAGEKSDEKAVEKAVFLAEKLRFPCVVKPSDNMGSRGCRLARNKDEAFFAVKDAFSSSRSKTIILEKYMDGPEFSIDALIYEGTMTITGFADRHINYSPYFIETGHTIPSLADEKTKAEIFSVFALGAKALGLSEGAAKADIKFTEKGAEIGEIAARLSGGYMSGWTFPYSSDFNLTKEALRIAMGKIPSSLLERRVHLDFCPPENLKNHEKPFDMFEIPSLRTSAERAWISIPGKIKSVERIDDFGNLSEFSMNISETTGKPSENQKNFPGGVFSPESELKDVFPRGFKAGCEVDFPRNNVTKCGNSISVSDNYKKAVEASEKASGSVLIVLEKNSRKTDGFLDGKENPGEKGFPPSAFSCYEKIKEMRIEGKIKADSSVLENVPSSIEEFLSLPEKDWNYRTAAQEAELFDRLKQKHAELSADVFWKALFRGGIQAALYVGG